MGCALAVLVLETVKIVSFRRTRGTVETHRAVHRKIDSRKMHTEINRPELATAVTKKRSGKIEKVSNQESPGTKRKAKSDRTWKNKRTRWGENKSKIIKKVSKKRDTR
jgi:hypothetical protein